MLIVDAVYDVEKYAKMVSEREMAMIKEKTRLRVRINHTRLVDRKQVGGRVGE